jgi:hypothetical protein
MAPGLEKQPGENTKKKKKTKNDYFTWSVFTGRQIFKSIERPIER